MTESVHPTAREEKAALNKRFETAAWGLFLVLVGGLLFVPRTQSRAGCGRSRSAL